MNSNKDQEQSLLHQAEAQVSQFEQKKTSRRRNLEIILLYICLPLAVSWLFIDSLLKLAGRRPPTSAWVMAGTGLCLIIGWVVYLIVRKKPLTPTGCLLASFIGLIISTTVMASIPRYNRAYSWYFSAVIIFSVLLIVSLVWCIIRYPKFRSVLLYFLITVFSGAFLMFVMTGVTEIVYGKGTVFSYLRIAAFIAVLVLVNVKDIRKHFRMKKTDGKEQPDVDVNTSDGDHQI